MMASRLMVIGSLWIVLLGHCVDACGWSSVELSGTVQSPDFPNNYTSFLNCVYVITAPSKYRVTLTFTDFDLEKSVPCLFDYVEIRDGGSEDSPLLGRYCGKSLPTPERTFGNQMWIKFASDGIITGRGFNATYTSADLQLPFFLITISVPGSEAGGDILRIDVETRSNYKIPMDTTLYTPVAVDYDPVGKTVYWTEVGLLKGIRRADLSGSDVQRVLDGGADSLLEGLAVDPLSRLIFYTDRGRHLIAMLTMSTLDHKTLINTDLDQPRAIVLNPADGVMFWTDLGASPKIERANYDGSDRRTVVGKRLHYINALALDVPNNHLYWADAESNRVEMSDMDGNGRTALLDMDYTHHFSGLALLQNSLYITDQIGGETAPTMSVLLRVSLDTDTYSAYAYSGRILYNDIHVYLPQPSSANNLNGCSDNKGGCEVICIPLPSNSRQCMCPDDHSLNTDHTTCERGTSTSEKSTSLNIAAIAGGAAGAAVVIIILLIIVCIVVKRIGRRQDPSQENPYNMPDAARIPTRDDQPYSINRAFDGNQFPVYHEAYGNARNRTLENVDDTPGDDYLNPVPPPPPLPNGPRPVPHSWQNNPTRAGSYLHVLPDPANDDYVPKTHHAVTNPAYDDYAPKNLHVMPDPAHDDYAPKNLHVVPDPAHDDSAPKNLHVVSNPEHDDYVPKSDT